MSPVTGEVINNRVLDADGAQGIREMQVRTMSVLICIPLILNVNYS